MKPNRQTKYYVSKINPDHYVVIPNGNYDNYQCYSIKNGFFKTLNGFPICPCKMCILSLDYREVKPEELVLMGGTL